MKSSSPRTALTGLPSGDRTESGTPKNARKYKEAVSSSISRESEVTMGILAWLGFGHGGHRPPHPGAARGRRTDVVHRPGQGDRPVHVRRAPASTAARGARPDPRLRRDGGPRRAGAAGDRVHLDPADRPVPAGRLTRAAAGHRRDRELL